MNYYECHITIRPDSAINIEMAVEKLKWKFSAINNDPNLGKELFCYATKHYPGKLDLGDIITEIQDATYSLKKSGLNVIREKIELIVYDTKGAKND